MTGKLQLPVIVPSAVIVEGMEDPQACLGGQLHSRRRSAIIRRRRLACSRSMLLSSMMTSTLAVPDTAPATPKKGFLSPRLPLILKAISPHQIKLAPHRGLLNRAPRYSH